MATKKRQEGRYPWKSLTSSERFRLDCGNLPNPHCLNLTSWEAVKAAWAEHRDRYMQPEERGVAPYGYRPGRRPWAYWVLDLGLADTPKDERRELERRGLLTHRERLLLQEEARQEAEWASTPDVDADEDEPEAS
jgi:hypothetical protein